MPKSWCFEQARQSMDGVSFTAVAHHLINIMRDFGEHHPHVAVDRQSGRTRYRELLSQVFEGASINVLIERFIPTLFSFQ